MPAETGAERGRPHGDRSVQGDGPEEGSASSAHAARPTVPTRRWEMTPQEQDMMDSFRQDYLDLLASRVATIRRLVMADQVEPAQVALLSLESSSAMVGAEELVAAVKQLRAALSDRGSADLDPLLDQLDDAAGAARRRLEDRPG